MKRKCVLMSCSAVFALLFVCVQIALAGGYESLTPLLVDLKDWKSEKAEGMTMDMGGMKMINATRTYSRAGGELNAMVMVGNKLTTQAQMQDMKMETTDTKVSVTTIDGFRVHMTYDKKEHSGSLMVYLSQSKTRGAVFMFTFEGMSEGEGLKLAKKFNWKKMKKAAEKLL